MENGTEASEEEMGEAEAVVVLREECSDFSSAVGLGEDENEREEAWTRLWLGAYDIIDKVTVRRMEVDREVDEKRKTNK